MSVLLIMVKKTLTFCILLVQNTNKFFFFFCGTKWFSDQYPVVWGPLFHGFTFTKNSECKQTLSIWVKISHNHQAVRRGRLVSSWGRTSSSVVPVCNLCQYCLSITAADWVCFYRPLCLPPRPRLMRRHQCSLSLTSSVLRVTRVWYKDFPFFCLKWTQSLGPDCEDTAAVSHLKVPLYSQWLPQFYTTFYRLRGNNLNTWTN